MDTYAQHYQIAQRAYTGPSDTSKYTGLYQLTIDGNVLTTNPHYFSLVNTIADKMAYKYDNNIGCHMASNGLSQRLNEWHDIEEVKLLADYVMPQLEEKVFQSHLAVEFVHPYRNCVATAPSADSWLWHYDDCPKEFLKLVIYLNDVTEDNGCFQYVIDNIGRVPVIESYRTHPAQTNSPKVFPRSRVPQGVVDKIIEAGGSEYSLLGKAGSYAVLTPNIMHRATVPLAGTEPRSALFFFIRPILRKKTSNYITGETKSHLPPRNVKRYELD